MKYWQVSPYKICLTWMLFTTLDAVIGVDRGVNQNEVNKHLVKGGEFLARGQLQDALFHYNSAVDGDKNNYLTFFKRGTVYLALGKAKFAISDLNKVLELKPDFAGARYQRAHVLLKQGNLHEAILDFKLVYEYDGNTEAYENALRSENLLSDINLVKSLVDQQQYTTAVDLLSAIIETCPWSVYLRELRSQCYVALNDPMSAILDLRSTTKLLSDNTDGYFKLSILHYQLGQPLESLKEVRDCLKLDPDHKDCFPHYKKVKKIDKFYNDIQEAINSENYDTCIESANKILKTENKVAMIQWLAHSKLCKCYMEKGKTSESIESCNSALAINKDPEVLCDRAEAHIGNELFNEAIRDYSEALEIHRDYQRAKEGMQKVQNLQKQSEKRDYYKILSVGRKATKKEIVKAYRKAAQQWHPDNFPEGPEKKKAENKFIDIAAAKEVLTDPEKRKKFDLGEDPLDPESGNHHGPFNPFQQFHHFSSESPFTFKFHFN